MAKRGPKLSMAAKKLNAIQKAASKGATSSTQIAKQIGDLKTLGRGSVAGWWQGSAGRMGRGSVGR